MQKLSQARIKFCTRYDSSFDPPLICMHDTVDIFSPEYWDERYVQKNVPWDLGQVSPPLKKFLSTYPDKHARILIPGGGYGHELAWMLEQGFTRVQLLDWSKAGIQYLEKLYPEIPASCYLCENFFEHKGQYDLILEQTFFCALPPQIRPRYIKKVSTLLDYQGQFAGVWFQFPLTEKGPPYGGHSLEYQSLLSLWFEDIQIEPCLDSHIERKGRELFIIARKKEI